MERRGKQLTEAGKKRALEAELQQHCLRYTNQLQRCELAKQHGQVSQENAALARKQYRLGRLTALAREAQQHAEEAAIRLLEATYAAKKQPSPCKD